MSRLSLDPIAMINTQLLHEEGKSSEVMSNLAEGILEVSKDELTSRGAKDTDEIARDIAELTKQLSLEFGLSAEEIANKVKNLVLGEE
jgi:hypothetical protein